MASSTPALVNANLLWLAAIVFLPVPTVLIVDVPGHDPLASAAYVATVRVAEIATRIQEQIIVRSNLLEPGVQRPAVFFWADWITVILTFVALVLVIVLPVLGLYPLLILLLSRPLNWLIGRTVRPAVSRANAASRG
ncbi:hypothetical protein [Subtercola sp. YIM 133946]|uniref:hypothetical protein n=1 Tax=Subtercola sp. YIM 133946 TaxID=3118909 RepID=UPI002F922441